MFKAASSRNFPSTDGWLPSSLAARRVVRRSIVLFQIGKIQVSQDILQDPTITAQDLISAFERYIKGDWGYTEEYENLRNDVALTSGEEIRACYRSTEGTEFHMITHDGKTYIVLPGGNCQPPFRHFQPRRSMRE